jgi:hypothetical protein
MRNPRKMLSATGRGCLLPPNAELERVRTIAARDSDPFHQTVRNSQEVQPEEEAIGVSGATFSQLVIPESCSANE